MSSIQANCPICDAQINLADDVEETEIITCSDCGHRVVVEEVNDGNVTLGEAPEIEEDWGE